MPNSVAEAYLLIVRESLVPVIGEAVPVPFTGQIELDSWDWDLKNDELANQKKAREKAKERQKDIVQTATWTDSDASEEAPPFKGDELIRAVANIHRAKGMDQKDRDIKVMKLIKKAVADLEDAAAELEAEEGDKDDENKMTFKFEKNVDLASTQLLNAMAKGDVMPRAVLTLFHRSSNAPVTLVITFGEVRLTSYDVSVDATETMSDLKETWEASYETVNYVYQNRPAASGPNFVTQGTARVFAMKVKLPF